jgi:hypothetical protein
MLVSCHGVSAVIGKLSVKRLVLVDPRPVDDQAEFRTLPLD